MLLATPCAKNSRCFSSCTLRMSWLFSVMPGAIGVTLPGSQLLEHGSKTWAGAAAPARSKHASATAASQEVGDVGEVKLASALSSLPHLSSGGTVEQTGLR